MAERLKDLVIWVVDSGTLFLLIALIYGLFLPLEIHWGRTLMASIAAGGMLTFGCAGIYCRREWNRRRRIAERGKKPPTAANDSESTL